ncbi:MAG: hypothetical protein HWE23_04305 [Rhodobacteraceae bacterium]|nr:hypothetical protein [Paracoccaceae bacterium]
MIHFLLSIFSEGFMHRLLSHMESRLHDEITDKEKSVELAVEQVRAEIHARAQARKFSLIDDGLPFSVSRMGRLVFVLPLGIWWAALCIDNVFHFGWNITDVPVLKDWGGLVVTSLFLADGAKGVTRIAKVRGLGGRQPMDSDGSGSKGADPAKPAEPDPNDPEPPAA